MNENIFEMRMMEACQKSNEELKQQVAELKANLEVREKEADSMKKELYCLRAYQLAVQDIIKITRGN